MAKINIKSKNILYISDEQIDLEKFKSENEFDYLKIRKKVEPWLTALFQSEHLSLLVGTGLSTALSIKVDNQNNPLNPDSSESNSDNQKNNNQKNGNSENLMGRMNFSDSFKVIAEKADKEAKELGRGQANFEDDFRVALKLLEGYEIIKKLHKARSLEKKLENNLKNFIESILENERNFLEGEKKENQSQKKRLLENFLLSFGSRTATRERLNIFTTNYDRFIEYGLDEAGLLTIDRFIGKLNPTMHFHRIELDYHYNPPGIRGEPRYVEGVVKFTKLHGSLDWKFENNKVIKIPLPFGADKDFEKYLRNMLNSVVIFPNSSKAYETSFFPYSELFRDFSSAICRPNSVLVTYGYGFGDSHINRIILDMLTIPSTHLVIISYDNANGRIENFIKDCNLAQLTLLIGKELGDFEKLVSYYLPKPAIDRISEREQRIREKRGEREETHEQKLDLETNTNQ